MRALKLYAAATCPFCHRVEIVAKEKKIPFERVAVGLREEMPAWYKEMNPRETVPLLEVGDKRFVYESALIAQYFNNSNNDTPSLMGRTPYQRHRIEFFMSQVGDFLSAAHGLLADPLSDAKWKEMDENAAYVDSILAENQTTGPFYCDEEFTMADVVVVPFLVRLVPALMYYTGYDVFSKAPHLKAMWVAAIRRPSVQGTMLTPEEYIEGYRHIVPDTAPVMAAKGGNVLYSNKLCPFADRSRLACAVRKFHPYVVEIPLHPQPEWYRHINPRQTVPVFVTSAGQAVHESQLIVNFVDTVATEGHPLIPRGDAEKEYEVGIFVENVSNFTGAMFSFVFSPNSSEAKEELVWAAGELEKQLDKRPFGKGPFFGGASMNAGDIALLPILVRVNACMPELTDGYDLLAAFPHLKTLVEAGLESDAGKEVFADRSVYTESLKALRSRK